MWDEFTTWYESFLTSPLGILAQVIVIILIAALVVAVMRVVIRRVVSRIVTGVKSREGVTETRAIAVSPLATVRVVQRTRTIGSVLSNIVNVVVFIVALLMIISTINPDILGSFALLSAAIGAGLGFGAQNIVKDILNGLFMVIEDQLGVGDVVNVGDVTGVVERVGIRITHIRDVNGTLWFVRNGEILRVGNMSQGWARVIIDTAVPYTVDLADVQNRLLSAATSLVSTSQWGPHIIDTPEMWGIESVSDDNIVLRLVVKTRTSSRDAIARELREQIKKIFDEIGIKPPSLSAVILNGYDGAGSVNGAAGRRYKGSKNVISDSRTGQK